MGTLVRNFLNTLRRFKLATSLNIASLAVAFAAFLVIMMQIDYERTFDRCYSTSDRIYRVDRMREANDYFGPVVPRAFFNAVAASSPHVEASSLLSLFSSPVYFMTVGEGAEQRGFREVMMFCYPDFVRIFDFQKVDGDLSCLSDPEKVIIPESMARRMFGNEQAVGQQINVEDNLPYKGNLSSFTVGAVYKDLPANTQLENVIYTAMDKEGENDWYGQSSLGYILLNSPESKEIVEDSFNKTFDFGQHGCPEKGAHLKLTPLADIYYLPNQITDFCKVGNPDIIKILLLIALLVMIVAGINFTNFSTSLAPMRIKSINTQKVLGSSDKVLRTGLLVEAVSTSFIAYLISLWLLVMIGQTQIASLVDGNWSIGTHPFIIGGTALIAVAVGLLAGLYPSFYITSFPPALVLKGSFGLSLSGRRMRNVLVGIQYIASFILIISASFMFLQNYFVQHAPVGYDRDQMIVAELNTTINENSNAFVNQLKTFSGIEDVTFSQFAISSQDQYTNWARDYKDKQIRFECLPVSSSFLEVMGIQVREGRGFRPEDDLKDSGCFIFNEKARAEYGLELNEKLADGEIIGFIPDIKFASLRQEVSPMAFYLCGKNQWEKAFWGYKGDGFYYNIAYIKVKAGTNLQAAMEHVNASLTKLDSEYPFTVRFYDEILQQTYEKEMKISMLITLFSLVAIFISIVGVFGLVVFESEYRRKEIAIRKVLGSTIREVLLMFNRGYLTILMICFVLGAPVAWYGVSRWLENFAYRTPMYWWVFPLAFLLVGMITAATVTYQNWCVASENPVENIKSE